MSAARALARHGRVTVLSPHFTRHTGGDMEQLDAQTAGVLALLGLVFLIIFFLANIDDDGDK